LPAPTVCWSTVIFAGVADVAGLRPACIAMLASRCQGRIQNFVLGRILAGCLGTSVPSEVQGQSPGEGLGRSPQKPEECYVMRLKKTRRQKNCLCRLTLYDNTIVIIISSTRRFMFPAIFVLKYKTQSAGSSEMVHNGSRFWNVVSMDLQKDARLQLTLGRRRSDSR